MIKLLEQKIQKGNKCTWAWENENISSVFEWSIGSIIVLTVDF